MYMVLIHGLCDQRSDDVIGSHAHNNGFQGNKFVLKEGRVSLYNQVCASDHQWFSYYDLFSITTLTSFDKHAKLYTMVGDPCCVKKVPL